MTRVLLVPDLPLERWPSMDRYAHRLYDWLESGGLEFEVRLAASIGALTREQADGRRSGAFMRWWTQPVDPVDIILPGPLVDRSAMLRAISSIPCACGARPGARSWYTSSTTRTHTCSRARAAGR